MKLIIHVAYLIGIGLTISAAAASSIVINEMELNPREGGSMWVELYNSGNQSLDISGWYATITDGGWSSPKMYVPKGSILPSKGFFVVEGNPQWSHDNGGYTTLYNEAGEKVDESSYRTDTLKNDFTWGRHPDGYDTDTDGDWGFGYASKGDSNQIGKA